MHYGMNHIPCSLCKFHFPHLSNAKRGFALVDFINSINLMVVNKVSKLFSVQYLYTLQGYAELSRVRRSSHHVNIMNNCQKADGEYLDNITHDT